MKAKSKSKIPALCWKIRKDMDEKPKRKKAVAKAWSSKEDRVLITSINTRTLGELARKLNRTEDSVSSRIRVLRRQGLIV